MLGSNDNPCDPVLLLHISVTCAEMSPVAFLFVFGFTAQILGLDIIIGCISHQAWQAVLLGLNILMHIYPIWIEICITFSLEETNYNSLFKIRSK